MYLCSPLRIPKTISDYWLLFSIETITSYYFYYVTSKWFKTQAFDNWTMTWNFLGRNERVLSDRAPLRRLKCNFEWVDPSYRRSLLYNRIRGALERVHYGNRKCWRHFRFHPRRCNDITARASENSYSRVSDADTHILAEKRTQSPHKHCNWHSVASLTIARK